MCPLKIRTERWISTPGFRLYQEERDPIRGTQVVNRSLPRWAIGGWAATGTHRFWTSTALPTITERSRHSLHIHLEKEYERLTDLGVEFSMTPREAGTVMIAVLDDTCGNHIQLMQELWFIGSSNKATVILLTWTTNRTSYNWTVYCTIEKSIWELSIFLKHGINLKAF